jgi:hypothetical protein
MAKTKKAKESRRLGDPRKYLVAGPGGATHQTAEVAQGSLTTNQGAVPRSWRISHSGRRLLTSTTSAFQSALFMLAGPARTATSR